MPVSILYNILSHENSVIILMGRQGNRGISRRAEFSLQAVPVLSCLAGRLPTKLPILIFSLTLPHPHISGRPHLPTHFTVMVGVIRWELSPLLDQPPTSLPPFPRLCLCHQSCLRFRHRLPGYSRPLPQSWGGNGVDWSGESTGLRSRTGLH